MNGSTDIYTGNGSSGVYVWGAQLEQGTFQTSYIPTTTAQVTRAADVAAVNALSPWCNEPEGTLFVEAGRLTGTQAIVTVVAAQLGSNLSNRITLSIAEEGVAVGSIVSSNGIDAFNSGNITASAMNKVAMAYKQGDYASSFNGGLKLGSSANPPPSFSKLWIGSNSVGYFNGHIRKLKYYPKRLTNSELQALTA